MTYQILKIVDNDGILTVTITREKALNALNRPTFDELEHFFNNSLTDYPNMTGIILTGAGPKSFVAGADISEFLTLGTCLLYTSPSPRDATLSRMPSSA